jgi:hypothetical protein
MVPVLLEVEIVIANLEKCKSPDSVQIPAEQIKAEGETLLSEIHKIHKEELPNQWNESIIVPIFPKVIY